MTTAPAISPPLPARSSASPASVALIVVAWVVWIGVTLVFDFFAFMMLAFADSPGSAKAAGALIVPLFAWFCVAFALGVLLLGEHISRLRLIGILLAAVAVFIQSFMLGHFSWIALTLSLSFGFYGFFRKSTHVDSMDALTVETWILFPITSALILFWGTHEAAAFPHTPVLISALLIFGGPLTALPLALFAAGVRRIRLSTLGFLQYLNPTITLLLATLGFGEAFTRADMLAFGFVWIALVIVSLDSYFNRVKEPISNPEPA